MTGDPVRFSFALVPKKPVRLLEAAVLVYSERGARVAVLDLRRVGVWELKLSTEPVSIQGSIDALPLVEGEYRAGLYIRTDDRMENYLDLAGFNVVQNDELAKHIPYPACHRGIVELAFDGGVTKPCGAVSV